MSDLVLLALVVWREARGESRLAKVAVAMSILNRVDRPSWWGNTISTVVGRRLQYSSMTCPGDPQLVKWPINTDPSYVECLKVAEEAILFVAAQTGFLVGPRVMANMAMDRWLPARFSMLSDRQVTQNGVMFMG
jgi:hypothetical protein